MGEGRYREGQGGTVKVERFHAILGKLRLTPRQFGRLVGVASLRTPRRWASGENEIPEPVSIIMRLLERGKVKVEKVYDKENPLDLVKMAHQKPNFLSKSDLGEYLAVSGARVN